MEKKKRLAHYVPAFSNIIHTAGGVCNLAFCLKTLQFDTESRLADEAEPVSEIHFTPGNPRNIQVGISYQF